MNMFKLFLSNTVMAGNKKEYIQKHELYQVV